MTGWALVLSRDLMKMDTHESHSHRPEQNLLQIRRMCPSQPLKAIDLADVTLELIPRHSQDLDHRTNECL